MLIIWPFGFSELCRPALETELIKSALFVLTSFLKQSRKAGVTVSVQVKLQMSIRKESSLFSCGILYS